MRKHRIERNLAFPTEEFRRRIRTAAEERGFRTEQAFILAACENELKRGESAEATTQLEARVAATLANLTKELQSLFTLAHTQFALTNSLLQYVLTCMVEPPEDVLAAARARARVRYTKILAMQHRRWRLETKPLGGGTHSWQTRMRKDSSDFGRADRREIRTTIPEDTSARLDRFFDSCK